MKSLELVRIEASLHDWSRIECGCGRSAEHLPRELLEMLADGADPDLENGWAESHAFIQSNLMAPAVATTSIAMATLATASSLAWRRQLLRVLGILTSGDQDDTADVCLDVVRRGTWILYEELAAMRSNLAAAGAYDLLNMMDEQKDRLRGYHAVVRDQLPPDLR
ncbi:hypothetical protein [Streptomyces sp. ISL-100]|uniref:hypothetical protein n=1 Tax=Streptomyces sp. ISL-100 TaxID=2819173 RepID=UPI001BE9DE17|nr:hypothetical protein [Streptomyces sp. ISL-100]MBT2401211.1 hypothetical protein [Streptomyces sp. ISL-100]